MDQAARSACVRDSLRRLAYHHSPHAPTRAARSLSRCFETHRRAAAWRCATQTPAATLTSPKAC